MIARDARTLLVLWLLWVQFLTRMLKKSLFISKKKQINGGIFSHYSWVVLYILSPIFTKITYAPQKRWSYTIKMNPIKNVLGRSRMFDTTCVFSKWITVIRRRSCKKQYRTSRNVTDFPQKNKNKNITTMEYYNIGKHVSCVSFLYQSTPFLIFWSRSLWSIMGITYGPESFAG